MSSFLIANILELDSDGDESGQSQLADDERCDSGATQLSPLGTFASQTFESLTLEILLVLFKLMI